VSFKDLANTFSTALADVTLSGRADEHNVSASEG